MVTSHETGSGWTSCHDQAGRRVRGRHRAGAADPADRRDRLRPDRPDARARCWPARSRAGSWPRWPTPYPAAAEGVSAAIGAPVLSIEELLASDDVDAVAICSSTDTHVDLIIAAARAGKAIFCEKPVSLDLALVDRALAGRRGGRGAVHDRLQPALRPGPQVGARPGGRRLGRRPARPADHQPRPRGPAAGVHRGQRRHLPRHGDPRLRHGAATWCRARSTEVFARGAVRVDPRIGEAGDVDTAVTVLTHEDGTLTTIDNSREAVYGFDQRVEAFGNGGMAVSDNPARHAGWHVGPRGPDRRAAAVVLPGPLRRVVPPGVGRVPHLPGRGRPVAGRHRRRAGTAPPSRSPPGSRSARAGRSRSRRSGDRRSRSPGRPASSAAPSRPSSRTRATTWSAWSAATRVRTSRGRPGSSTCRTPSRWLTALDGCDAVAHLAIFNDFHGMYADRRAAQDGYVGLTRRVVDAANRTGARVGYVSTDWVFDGTGHLVDEEEPPNPVNFYGFLKAASELVVLERARTPASWPGSAASRGCTRPRTSGPRSQDVGFGYFVLSLVDALRGGGPVHGLGGPATSTRSRPRSCRPRSARCSAWPSRSRLDGVLHFAGGTVVTRRELALATCDVFGLDPDLLDFGPPPDEARLPAPVPYDTSMSRRHDDGAPRRHRPPHRGAARAPSRPSSSRAPRRHSADWGSDPDQVDLEAVATGGIQMTRELHHRAVVVERLTLHREQRRAPRLAELTGLGRGRGAGADGLRRPSAGAPRSRRSRS